ncbi:MAG: ABC transporter substrate-binding protein [Anaerolineae bacterium]|nr:ABC transporter substrate-binding protein [Anaerolineae bacterium]MDW8171207.1 ABC transporter substrate-binding protein [Anaerolineae bacterium]
MRRRALLLSLALAFLALQMSPVLSQEVAREDTVIFDFDRTVADPTNFNPFTPAGTTNRGSGAHQAMWEPLFILNYTTGQIDPWLGLSFEPNETQDVWTLKLRDGVKWSDGEAFNADDVVFTINMLLNDSTRTLANAADMQRHVKSVSKTDDLTVVFELNGPNPRFQVDYFSVRIVNSLLIMPEHVWAGQDPLTFTFYDTERGWPIGTGPYTLTSSETNRFVWDRNDAWWGAATGFMDLPEPLRLIWLSITNEETRVQLISNNEIDAANSVSLAAFEAIKARNPSVITWQDELPYAWADPCPRQLDINTTVKPWDNANMRRALSLLIDRSEIVDIAYEGTTSASVSMFVQYGSMQPFIDAVVEAGYAVPATADVAAGQALIEAEGWKLNNDGLYEKDGEVLSVEILVNNASTEYTRTIDVVVEQLRAAGIEAVARPVDNSTYWGSAAPSGDYEVAYGWLSCASVNEPWASMNRYTAQFITPIGQNAPGNNNTGRWNTEATAAYSEIVAQIGALPLGDPRVPDLVAEAYSYIHAETPFIPLVQASKLLVFNTTYWTGWPTAENSYNHPAFWWNSAHQIIHNLTRAK